MDGAPDAGVLAVSGVRAEALGADLDWLEARVDWAFRRHLGETDSPPPRAPKLIMDNSDYASCFAPEEEEELRLAVILALAPELRPWALDPLLIRNPNLDRRFTEFGGAVDSNGRFTPTIETFAFALGVEDVSGRLSVARMFEPDAPLAARRLIRTPPSGADLFACLLSPTASAAARLAMGRRLRPDLGEAFPARRLTTRLDWGDLVLSPSTLNRAEEILAWIEHREALRSDPAFGRILPQGYRCLFHGPAGTGKTLTATLLGKRSGRDVYRVDLSLVVSKWIGETEKNLAMVFDQAEGEDWILFFDEADALFGKRTDVRQSHDRHANQEVSYILQRVETFDGVVVLSSNLKRNIDQAFSRRFQAMIYFPAPGPAERLRLWRNALPQTRLDPEVDLEAIAEAYEITGGGIVNVALHAALASARGGGRPILARDIATGVARELEKEGRVSGAGP